MSTPQTIEKHSEVYNKIKIIVSLLDVCDDDGIRRKMWMVGKKPVFHVNRVFHYSKNTHHRWVSAGAPTLFLRVTVL